MFKKSPVRLSEKLDIPNRNTCLKQNLAVSYPNEQDIKDARALGKPSGGDIKIHGLMNKLSFISKFQR